MAGIRRVRAKQNLYYNRTFWNAGDILVLLTEKDFNKSVHEDASLPASAEVQTGGGKMATPIKAEAPLPVPPLAAGATETKTPELPAAGAEGANKGGTGDKELI